MSGHPDRIAEHYRKLAAEEVARRRWQSRMKRGLNTTRWLLSIGALRRPRRTKSLNDYKHPPGPPMTLGNMWLQAFIT